MGFGVRVSGVQTPVLERGLNESSIFLNGLANHLWFTFGFSKCSSDVASGLFPGADRVLGFGVWV